MTESAASASASRLGTLLVLMSAFLFALKAIVIKSAFAAVPTLDGVSLLALRMMSALPFYLAIVMLSPKSPTALKQSDWGLLVLAGLLGYYLASILDFIGLQYISASLERLILFLYPTLTVVLSAGLARKAIPPRTWLAIVLSYGGTLPVILGGGRGTPPAPGG